MGDNTTKVLAKGLWVLLSRWGVGLLKVDVDGFLDNFAGTSSGYRFIRIVAMKRPAGRAAAPGSFQAALYVALSAATPADLRVYKTWAQNALSLTLWKDASWLGVHHRARGGQCSRNSRKPCRPEGAGGCSCAESHVAAAFGLGVSACEQATTCAEGAAEARAELVQGTLSFLVWKTHGRRLAPNSPAAGQASRSRRLTAAHRNMPGRKPLRSFCLRSMEGQDTAA